MQSVSLAPVAGKKVIVRADLDLAESGGKPETFRLKRLIPTLQDILDRGGVVRLIAHRGRPNGVVDPSLSTAEFVPLLTSELGKEVVFGGDLTENSGAAGQVVLFENLRFHPGEEANSPDFTEQLVALGDLYVNESFATVHRSHASIVGIPKYRPHFAGLNLISEVENLTKVLENPSRPLVVILGGAKIETKKSLIEYMQVLADEILIGGALINEGLQPGEKLVLPQDNVEGKDIGTLTIARFTQSVRSAQTIVWNGPMGVFEDPRFATGTTAIARAVAASSAFKVVGGGDTVSALDELGLLPQMSFVSTGGGAMLEFLAGKTLPGLEALG